MMKMNKYILIFLLSFVCHWIKSQTIELMESKVTQLIFPAPIKTVKGGFLPSDFIMDIQENVLYIQPLGSFSESNLNVVTADEVYYTFVVRYNIQTTLFNHIIRPEQAIFGVKERAVAIVQEQKEAGIQEKILADQDDFPYCKAVRYKTTYMHLKGIYIHQDKLYIKLRFENLSNIAYDFEYVGFYIKEKKQRKNATQEQIQLTPENTYKEVNIIRPKGSIEIVYTFSKFTIGQEKQLLIDMIEKGGERNLSLKLNDAILLKAKKIL